MSRGRRAPPKVAFVTGRELSLGPEGARTDAGLGRLIDALAERLPGLEVAAALAPSPRGLHDHPLRLAPEALHLLPPMPTLRQGFAKALAARRQLAALEARSDALLIQLPFPAPLGLLGGQGPRLYHVCADVQEIVRSAGAYRGAEGVAARGLAAGIHQLYRRLTRLPGARAVTHGEALAARLGHPAGRAVVSSTLLSGEIASARRQRPAGAPFRVLFVGYLRPEKGVGVLIEAFRRLRERVPGAELAVVGAADVNERGVDAGLRAALAPELAAGRVQLLGQLGFGPALFQAFADADVLALPSFSEGTPRVLVEARAFGCPVVASAVGGVPSSVSDGVDGLLVPPGDPAALAAALARVAEDIDLRRDLIDKGLARARRTTVEAMADALAAEIFETLENQR